MIKFENLSKESPFILFKKTYDDALNAEQKNIEAVSISSFSFKTAEVNSRYVNLKIVDDNKFIFFSNYNSPKALEFNSHDQIAAKFFWSSIDTQIRIKANITKTSKEYNLNYFKKRSFDKNALAISSVQSKPIDSYDEVLLNFQSTKEMKDLSKCPDYWGGFSFTPYYFEFWEGNDSRINKRVCYEKIDHVWNKFFLQP